MGTYVGVRNGHGGIVLAVNEQQLGAVREPLDQRDRRERIEAGALRPLAPAGSAKPGLPRARYGDAEVLCQVEEHPKGTVRQPCQRVSPPGRGGGGGGRTSAR